MFINVWIWLVLWSKPQPSIPCVIIKISNNLNRSLKFCDRPSLFPGLWIRLTSHYHSAGRHESVLLFSKGWLHEEAALGRNVVVEMKRFHRHENIPLIWVCTNDFYSIRILNWCRIYAIFNTFFKFYLFHIILPNPMLKVNILYVLILLTICQPCRWYQCLPYMWWSLIIFF